MDNKLLLDNILFFLERKKWKKKDSRYSGMFLFEDANTGAELLFPKDPSSDNFETYLNNSIEIISAVEETLPSLVILSLNNVGKDLHSIRVPGNINALPLGFVEQTLVSINKLFELSARNELRNDHEVRENKELKIAILLKRYMNECSFAHTWKGSFGFTIEAPLNLMSIGLFSEVPENRERKISKRIFNGIKIINEAVGYNSVDYIVDNLEVGFDGRMCFQFYEISEQLKFPLLEYSTQWSPIVPIEERLLPIKKITLTSKTFSFAERAASKLLVSDDEKTVWFTGYPEVLRSQKEDMLDEKTFGEYVVNVKGSSQETKYATLRMELDFSRYKKALSAHKEGKDIRVKCLLKRKIKGWDVLKVYEFIVME
jgi:hypothetical protein